MFLPKKRLNSLLPLFLIFPLAQTTPMPTPAPVQQEIVQPGEVRALPGKLDKVLVFNSNSPELVQKEGILLSTFPAVGKSVPTAHLNFPLTGRFDIFAHHIAKATSPDDLRTLYLGVILHNPNPKPVTVDVLQAASYLSQPDAPFIELPSFVENPLGTVYSGPGSRVMDDVLRGKRQADIPTKLIIPPGTSRLLMNHPIPVKTLTPPLNGRSALIRLRSDRSVYIASLGMYARQNPDGTERAPSLQEWQTLLDNGDLVTPRDRIPTPLSQTNTPIIYGRVAGVALGSMWQAQLTDNFKSKVLSIPQPGQTFSYPLSTIPGGSLGTNQIQSAQMLARYSDTAYLANGNYGIQYSLTLPLVNPTSKTQTVTLAIQTPLKQDKLKEGLVFLQPPAPETFFRGTVQVSYLDDQGKLQERYIHLSQKRGEQGEPLVKLNIPAGDRTLVKVDFLYPPDASPPQVLTVKTI